MNPELKKDQVRKQFQQTGRNYRDSDIHAKGKDLAWITEEIHALPERPLLALDIATGTGHTAFALSRCIQRVVGLDLTPEMLGIARREAEAMGMENVTWMQGDAEALPFPDRLFDVVTCRLAAHHFPRPDRAFSEACRVLVPGGRLFLIDNVAPDDPGATRLLNRVETLRDPSHGAVHPPAQWTQLLKQHGFRSVTTTRTWTTRIRLKEWFDRAGTPESRRQESIRLLLDAPSAHQSLLGFDPSSPEPELILRKVMWICEK